MKGDIAAGKNLPNPRVVEIPKASSNHFVVLSSPKVPIIEEGELQQVEVQDDDPKFNTGSMEQAGAANSKLPSVGESLQEDHPSPNRAKTPPYAEITKNKPTDSSGSSDEDSIEQLSKKASRKSRKEAREEEANRLTMHGSQSTIEMLFG